MNIELIITIIITIIGWLIALYNIYLNNKLKKEERSLNWKKESYSQYLKKSDEIIESIRKSPNMVWNMVTELNQFAVESDPEKLIEMACSINEKIIELIKTSISSLSILRQELSSVLLVASDETSEHINKLIDLITKYNSDMEAYLLKISPQNMDSFKRFESIVQNIDLRSFEKYNKDILIQMRKELQIVK